MTRTSRIFAAIFVLVAAVAVPCMQSFALCQTSAIPLHAYPVPTHPAGCHHSSEHPAPAQPAPLGHECCVNAGHPAMPAAAFISFQVALVSSCDVTDRSNVATLVCLPNLVTSFSSPPRLTPLRI
jgi:hypothetical protein